jgi:hypothetical protein
MVFIGHSVDANVGMLNSHGLIFHGFDRRNDDIIASKLANLFEGFLAGTFTDREHSYHTAHTKDNT